MKGEDKFDKAMKRYIQEFEKKFRKLDAFETVLFKWAFVQGVYTGLTSV